MTRSHPHNQRRSLPRAACWLLALLCLWMGSGGVLHHTEGLPSAGASSALAAWGHVTPAAPADGCAACQWTQGVQSGPPLLPRVAFAFSFAAPPARRAPGRPLSRLPCRRTLRGPPPALS